MLPTEAATPAGTARPLRALLRTSSFRLSLLYTALTGACFLLLFAVLYVSAARYMHRQIDATVAAELDEVRSDAGATDTSGSAALAATVASVGAHSSGYFYLLQDASGQVLAGNLPAMAPQEGVVELRGPTPGWAGDRPGLAGHASGAGHVQDHDHDHDPGRGGIRGRGLRLADGGYLFVGLGTHQVRELQEMIVRAFGTGLVAAMLLALAGGALVSAGLLRRVEQISRTSREIIAGDLGRRISLSGRGDEFDHLAVSLNRMLDRIQTLMDGVRQVSTDIAHDLRTPLTRLRQRIERAQRQGGDAAALTSVLDGTLAELDAVLETFAALLRIAQIENVARRAGFQPLDLAEVLRTVVEVYQPAAEERAQLLSAGIPASLPLRGDRELLSQMFANLLENAVRHSPPAARIHLLAEDLGAAVRVQLQDSGLGIPAQQREQVLQRFVRLEASRSTPGNGLGLSLVAAVAGLHGAQLQLREAVPAPGLCVVVLLPRTET